MKTPITDQLAFDPSQYTYVRGDWFHVKADDARRLELDRAALMEALEQIEDEAAASWLADIARAALSAARANFPQQP